ncbi:bioA [Symbiodinium necroappetens]|uniref:BioA protein n=1 Tax=Symbiodinium necroappetens TaxID=1628268 RepID=A0A812XT76_9DINO|nr:bioA [Symbiodinium necroappetens]
MAFLLTPFCRCSNWGEAALEDGDADSVTRAVGDAKLKLPQAEEMAEFQDDDKPTAEDKESDHSTTATATGTQELPDSPPQQAEDPKEVTPLQEALVVPSTADEPVADAEKAEAGEQPKPGPEEKEEKEEKKVRRPPEPLTTLDEQDFNDRGVSSLDESKKFSYTIGNDYKCTLSGWTHTRPYACGFIRNKPGTAKAVVSGLDPDIAYLWKATACRRCRVWIAHESGKSLKLSCRRYRFCFVCLRHWHRWVSRTTSCLHDWQLVFCRIA